MINIIIRIFYKIGIIKYFNMCGNSKVNSRKYKIPMLGEIGIHNLFDWEPWMTKLLKEVIKIDGSKFIDVGANIGQTLLKIKSISSKINYIGFEPNPSCNHYINVLIEKNKIEEAIVLPIGISDKNDIEELALYNNTSVDGSASIVKNFRPGNNIFKIKLVAVFDANTIKRKIKFDGMSILKIDIEGAEYEVLSSLKNEIKKNQPIIFIEILPVYSKEHSNRLIKQQKIEEMVAELNYFIYKIWLNKKPLLRLERIDQIGINSDINQCDYIFVPQTKFEKFEKYCQQWLMPS
ncbi:MAG: FkbM family methyltransferase [Ulvibacter sp.]|jgi:FkbM family methyltransferase